MLNFDNNHQYIEGDITTMIGKKRIKKFIASGLIIVNLLTFSGCSKDVPCDIKSKHAHYYVSDEHLGRYIISEKESVSGLSRSDSYISIDKEEAELLNFINMKGLFRIDDNKQVINDITSNQNDFIEYRYKYTYLMPIPIIHSTGKSTYITFIFVPSIGYSWTTDTSKDLTGEQRTCHYVYHGYKITKNKRGKYELVRSDNVDNISNLPEGFDFIDKKFYDVVDLKNQNQPLDYEDGDEESHRPIEDYEESSKKIKKK